MRRLLPVATVAVAVLAFAASAGAKIIQVGPNLSGLTAEEHFTCGAGGTCLFSQKSPSYTAPTTGAIVEWQLKGAEGLFEIWVLDGNTGTVNGELGTAEGGKSSFPASIPIKANQRFGIEIFQKKDKLGTSAVAGSTVSGWSPHLMPGETRAPTQSYPGIELLANVRILPAPGITAVTPSSGPAGTQDPLTITGHDFTDVTSVAFGGLPANYEVRSETEIVAEAYAFHPGAAPVTVTTVAGTATAPTEFTFEEKKEEAPIIEPPPPVGSNPFTPVVIPPIEPLDIPPLTFPADPPECRVPKLKGKTLKQAKPLLTAAHCKLGKVTKRKGVKVKRGKVVGEIPPAGARAHAGWPVQVKLG
jgi:hypothetical protein